MENTTVIKHLNGYWRSWICSMLCLILIVGPCLLCGCDMEGARKGRLAREKAEPFIQQINQQHFNLAAEGYKQPLLRLVFPPLSSC